MKSLLYIISIESIEGKEMNRKVLSLKKLINGLLKNGAKEMTGRSRGIKIRELIEKILREEKGPFSSLSISPGSGPSIFLGPMRWWPK